VRLVKLRLIAYGHFRDTELHFAPRGIQVVYGRNEAGKSTTLRAIAGLLFGIPVNTTDGHLHKLGELRIGGSVADESGNVLEIVRRKGRANTLLDRENRPLDEAVLGHLLGGVSEEQFFTMFGLDHVSLRQGGAALLHGEGSAGESLFGAAMAGGELHKVLRELREEAEELFTPQARSRSLNEALKAWNEANKRTRDQSMSHESVQEQEKWLAEARDDRKSYQTRWRELQSEKSKLQRAISALPKLAKRRDLTSQRARLGEVVLLPPNAVIARVDCQRTAREATREIERIEEQSQELAKRRDALVIDESLVQLRKVPEDLVDKLGSQRKASRDLPGIEAKLDELDAGARTALREMGRDVPVADAEAWRINATAHATIAKIGRDLTDLDDEQRRTRQTIAARTARRDSLTAQLAELPPIQDVSALRKLGSRAEREGPLEQRLAHARRESSRLAKVADSQLSALGLADLALADAVGLPVPTTATVDRFAREWASLERDAAQIADHRTRLAERLSGLRRDIDELERGGKVPTEDDLRASRDRRDELWNEVRKGLTSPRSGKTAAHMNEADSPLTRYELESRSADEIADRLRREAARVSRLALLAAAREATLGEQQTLVQQHAAWTVRQTAARDEWNRTWQGILPNPRPPAEMTDWLVRHGALLGTIDQLGRAEADVATLDSTIASYAKPLLAQLIQHGVTSRVDQSLIALLDEAGDVVRRVDEAVANQKQLARDIAELDTEIATLCASDRQHDEQRASLTSAWRSATLPLAFPETASVAEVMTAIELLRDAFKKIDEAATWKRRADGIKRDARAFASDVEKVAREHAPDLLDLGAEEAAAKLIERFNESKKALEKRGEIERQLGEEAQRLAEQRARHAQADESLRQLLARASVSSIEELEAAERRSEEASRLDDELQQLDGLLSALGGDAKSLENELSDWEVDSARARLEDLDREQEEVRDLEINLSHRILTAEEGLKKLDNPEDRAAQAALDAETALARVRDLAERYLTVRIASVVLAREIERYREENQGPIVARASELFRRLTLGSFTSLKVDFDEKDNPVLLGVRSDGRELLAPAMSDGTRDQLFLALRVATLERYFEHGDPLPMVVDDILVHFDDERARAALEILAELSQRTQVLFFTHHERLVQLATEAIDPARLSIRELSDGAPIATSPPMVKAQPSAMVAPKLEPR
jgi:uncharacterized protein YhaN